MTLEEETIRIAPVRRLEFAFEPQPWPFAVDRRGEIDAYFAAQQKRNPAFWNGQVLILHRHAFDGEVFRGAFLQTDFASFLAWRNWDFPDLSVRNAFGMAALRTADGAFALGVMGAHTMNPGRCYFPAGTPDPSDIMGSSVDLQASVCRELHEETGLDTIALDVADDWHAVFAGPRIAFMKLIQSPDDAATLHERIRAHIASEAHPELADVRFVHDVRDLDDRIPNHTAAFIRHMLGDVNQER